MALVIRFIGTHPIKAKGLHHASSLGFDFRILVGGLETAAVQLQQSSSIKKHVANSIPHASFDVVDVELCVH